MNKNEKEYNIHNILTMKIVDNWGVINDIITNIFLEYKNFETTHVETPDLTIYLGDFLPSNQECTILDNRYYIKENYFYCEDSYKTAKWKFELQEFEHGKTNIRISANEFASMIISGFLIDPLINFKLNEKKCSLIHASGIAKEDYACIFSAQGGGGKTSTALYAIEKEYCFLGDNFIILNEGYALSFLSPLNLFSFNLVPIVRKNMRLRSKIEFYLKNLLHTITGLRIVTKINPSDLFSDSLLNKASIKSIFLLVAKEKIEITDTKNEKIVDHMVLNMMIDSFPFIKYMMEYSYVFPESKMASHWKTYKDNLLHNIESCKNIHEVHVPQKYDRTIFEEIFKVIYSDTNSEL